MSQALIEFILISVVIAAVVSAWLQVRKLRKALEDSRSFAERLQQELAFSKANAVYLDAATRKLKEELLGAIEWNAQLQQEIEIHKALPLEGLTDDQLVEVIRKEVEYRVSCKYLSWFARGDTEDGQPFWKLASKVGGASFRVVDKAKRGKLTVQS